MASGMIARSAGRLTSALLGIVALGLCVAALAGCEEPAREGRERVVMAGRTFWLEPALDDATRLRGLGGRATIEPEGGMLFVFTAAAPLSFVMRDCLTDIDIAFLDGSGRVVATHEMKMEAPRGEGEEEGVYEARLKKYPSRYASQIVVEVGPGTLRKLGVKAGDLVTLEAEGLKRRAK